MVNGVKLTRNHIKKGSKRSGRKIIPTTLTIHSTANPKSSAINERGWLDNKTNQRVASWHEVIDEKELIQAIPLDEEAYHAGKREGNRTSLSLEICESGDREKTLRNAVKVTAFRLHERGWQVNRVRRHYDWSGKNCPSILSANRWQKWQDFIKDVQGELLKLEKGESEAEMKVYNQVSDIPTWGKEAILYFIDCGVIKGDREGLSLSESDIRQLVFLYRNEKRKVYHYLRADDIKDKEEESIVPSWGEETCKKVIDKGLLKRDGHGCFTMTEDMLKVFVAHDRLDLYA